MPIEVIESDGRVVVYPDVQAAAQPAKLPDKPPSAREQAEQFATEQVPSFYGKPKPMTATDWLLAASSLTPGTRMSAMILKNALAGGLGAAIEGKPIGTTAGLTAGATAAAEGVLRGGGLVARHTPGIRQWLEGRMAKQATKIAGDVSPGIQEAWESSAVPLGARFNAWMGETQLPSRIADRIREVVRPGGAGSTALSARLTSQIAEIETLLGPMRSDAFIHSPQLTSIWRKLTKTEDEPMAALVAKLGASARTQDYTLGSALALLREARSMARGIKNTDPIRNRSVIEGAELAEQEIRKGLGGVSKDAVPLFDTMNREYAAGRAFQDLMSEALEPGVKATLSPTKLAAYMAEHQPSLERRFGKQTFDDLWAVIGRGATLGTRDTTKGASFGLTSPVITGAGTVIPGNPFMRFGRTYVGTPPLQPVAPVRRMADWLAAQRAASLAGQEIQW